jgi:catechol 2,3-dioxygenase-like lactoylglutathione lyase family enzyme
MPDMIGHLSFGVSDLPRAMAFYDAVLAELGYVRVWADDTAAGYGTAGGNDRFALKLQPGAVVPPRPGFHLAFNAPDRAAVDRFHAEALRHGGQDRGAPGPRPDYGDTYYAAFVLDPDGHKLEAVHQ